MNIADDLARAYDDGYAQGKADAVVHGKWIKNRDKVGWHCSCCKSDNYYAYCWNSDTGKDEFQDNYCPNCGADMREES